MKVIIKFIERWSLAAGNPTCICRFLSWLIILNLLKIQFY